jgi:hypothetical protein
MTTRYFTGLPPDGSAGASNGQVQVIDLRNLTTLLPGTDGSYSVGAPTRTWRAVYTEDVRTEYVTVPNAKRVKFAETDTTLDDVLEAANSGIATLTTDLAALAERERLDTLSKDTELGEINTELGEINTELEAINTTVAQAKLDITQLQTEQTALQTEVGTLTGTVDLQDTRITELEDSVITEFTSPMQIGPDHVPETATLELYRFGESGTMRAVLPDPATFVTLPVITKDGGYVSVAPLLGTTTLPQSASIAVDYAYSDQVRLSQQPYNECVCILGDLQSTYSSDQSNSSTYQIKQRVDIVGDHDIKTKPAIVFSERINLIRIELIDGVSNVHELSLSGLFNSMQTPAEVCALWTSTVGQMRSYSTKPSRDFAECGLSFNYSTHRYEATYIEQGSATPPLRYVLEITDEEFTGLRFANFLGNFSVHTDSDSINWRRFEPTVVFPNVAMSAWRRRPGDPLTDAQIRLLTEVSVTGSHIQLPFRNQRISYRFDITALNDYHSNLFTPDETQRYTMAVDSGSVRFSVDGIQLPLFSWDNGNEGVLVKYDQVIFPTSSQSPHVHKVALSGTGSLYITGGRLPGPLPFGANELTESGTWFGAIVSPVSLLAVRSSTVRLVQPSDFTRISSAPYPVIITTDASVPLVFPGTVSLRGARGIYDVYHDLTVLKGIATSTAPVINITSCAASDSWLVYTDNTNGPFQVQATPAFNSTVISDIAEKPNPQFWDDSGIITDANWPNPSGWRVRVSNLRSDFANGRAWGALSKGTSHTWATNPSTFKWGGDSDIDIWHTIEYPGPVMLRSIELKKYSDNRTQVWDFHVSGSDRNDGGWVLVQAYSKQATWNASETFQVTNVHRPYQFWKVTVTRKVPNSDGWSFIVLNEIVLNTGWSRGRIALVSAVPVNVNTFKLVLADANYNSDPVDMSDTPVDWDFNIMLTQNGQIVNAGLYRFSRNGVVTKL